MERWEPDYFPTLAELESRCGVRVFPRRFSSSSSSWSGMQQHFLEWVKGLQAQLRARSDCLRVEASRFGHEHGAWVVTLIGSDSTAV